MRAFALLRWLPRRLYRMSGLGLLRVLRAGGKVWKVGDIRIVLLVVVVVGILRGFEVDGRIGLGMGEVQWMKFVVGKVGLFEGEEEMSEASLTVCRVVVLREGGIHQWMVLLRSRENSSCSLYLEYLESSHPPQPYWGRL